MNNPDIPYDFPKWMHINGDKWPKPIKEWVLCVISVIILVFCCYLAIYHLLSPIIFIIILGVLFGSALFVTIKYQNVNPWHHFNRNFEGILFSSTPLMALFYFITWIWDGMTPIAQYRAELMVIYGYFLFIWVVFADIPIIGIYFSVRVFSFWTLQIIWQYGDIDLPFVFYVSGILYSLMGLGVWFTSTAGLIRVLIRKDSYGDQTSKYIQTAKVILPLKLIIGVILIIFEQNIASAILNVIPFDKILTF